MKPLLVYRPNWRGGFPSPVRVADFSNEIRPAFRVQCHCRNCSWDGEARFAIGTVIPQWVLCPTCETEELSCHGKHAGRDELSREEEDQKHEQYRERLRENHSRLRA